MDSKQLATVPATDQAVAFVPNKENVELLKKTLAGAGTILTDSELQLTIYTANKRGLDPLTRQIYPMKDYNGRLTFITAIDGYRLVAERTGRYEGQTQPQWCGKDGKWLDVWLSDEPPAAAKVGVYKKGFREALISVARWSSYVQTTKDGKPRGQWAKGGDNQLSKCAESLALRKAFPEDLGGLHTDAEMGQVDNDRQAAEPTVIEPQKATKEQIELLGSALKDQGLSTAEERKAWVLETGGVSSVNDLSSDQAAELMDRALSLGVQE